MIVDLARAVRVEDEVARRGGLGLKRRGQELAGPCPRCGGRDRFAVSIRKGLFLCRGCSAGGDVIALVQFLDGCSFGAAVRRLFGDRVEMSFRNAETPRAEHRPVKPAKAVDDADRHNTERALQLWADASPITGTLAEVYLRHHRGLQDLPGADVLRVLHGSPWQDGREVCLLALYRDVLTNEPRAIARTALDSYGRKIGRLSLGPTRNAAVKLDCDESVEYGLTIAEGVETAIAARMKGLRPCWAVGSAGAMRRFPVLSGIQCLTLAVDNDHADQRGRRAGEQAAAACWRRWADAGREVRAFTTNQGGAKVSHCEGSEPKGARVLCGR